MSVKRDTTRPMVLKVQSPIVIKIVWIVTLALAMIAIAASAFTLGYAVAWRKVGSVYNDAILLEAKANKLEEQIIRLGNSQAYMAAVLYETGIDVPTIVRIAPDTVICTLEVSTPAQTEGVRDE